MGDLTGDKVFDKFGYEFPLLIKFIDASDKLSIQVHPDDSLAKKRHGSFGKTEMWYVIQADENATITAGFNRQVTREEYLQLLNNNNLESILNTEKTVGGDVFFLPAGRIHAIGTLLAEIQQSSDITYRIYDYDRKDTAGKSRELHTGLALDAIDYNFYEKYKTDYSDKINDKVNLADCTYFHTNLYTIDKPLDFGRDSFVIIICVDGKLNLEFGNGMIDVSKGETVLIPAVIKNIYLTPQKKSRLLEVYVP